MSRARLELALERMDSGDWRRFEQFASGFLVVDFPNLRTVAAGSTDDGRDSELFAADGDPTHLLQYSVASDWAAKVRKTIQRIKVTSPNCASLTYATSRRIGAKADDLKRESRNTYSIQLDIRDASYFLDRFAGDAHLEAVAESLAKEFVDPFLEGRGIVEHTHTPLSQQEARTALVFLHLQKEDDANEKGLTKTTYDAIVRSVLRGTSSDNRVSRSAVYAHAEMIAPAANRDSLMRHVDVALVRLEKQVVRHHTKDDSFCLTFEEGERLKVRLAEIELQNLTLANEIRDVVVSTLDGIAREQSELQADIDVCRRVIERFVFQQGEQFATAVTTGKFEPSGMRAIEPLIKAEIVSADRRNNKLIARLTVVVTELLSRPSAATSSYLRGLSNAYTLLAFLQQTEDVQQVIQRMFTGGEIWLDTSLLLPLLAEDLVPEEQKRFRLMFKLAAEAGVKFFITDGVVEELERHINRCSVCASTQRHHWQGNVPFLLSFFVSTGRGIGGFKGWIERFVGDVRPLDDLATFLSDEFGIRRRSLDVELQSSSEDFRYEVKEAWVATHQARRERTGAVVDPTLVNRLAEHDTENYVGVVMRRKEEYDSPFGFTCWWLTLDAKAFHIAHQVATRLNERAIPSPVMSVDFLTTYLSIGPVRSRVRKGQISALPLVFSVVEDMDVDLLDAAETVRAENADLPEYALRRKVRDSLDMKKRQIGKLASLGLDAIIDRPAVE